MTDHVLGDENGTKSLSVMHQKRVPDKIRCHHRAPRPGFDRFFRARVVHLVDLLQENRLDEGSFLQRSRHKNQITFCAGARELYDRSACFYCESYIFWLAVPMD